MSRYPIVSGNPFPTFRKFALATTATTCLALTAVSGQAAAATLATGDAVVTRFSGTVTTPGSEERTIDVQGIVATALGLQNPGFVADGRQLLNEQQKLQITAGEVGQVFGIAMDDAQPANIYLTATSAFGLHRDESGAGWMDGMWGAEGGPGTIYKLNAENGYKPEVFANITLNDRENTGAALGNIAFDAKNKQLLVTDLETGTMHRISVEDGRELGTFDHGTQARAGFYDVPNETWQALDPVAFDPASSAQLGECDKAGDAAIGAGNPACWNVADFRRRVWGVGVRTDSETGETRVYYGIWGAKSLGNADWEGAGDDAKNSVWSVALGEDGSFQTESARREFIVPGFFIDEDKIEKFGEAGPVADIAFSSDGKMLIGERGGLRNLGLSEPEAFSNPYQSRVLQYAKAEDGTWQAKGRYDVGFDDRKDNGRPHIRAHAGGGVDFGYGYDENGKLDVKAKDESVLAAGDGLCSETGPCMDPETQERTDTSRVDGVQISPESELSEVSPVSAFQPYPEGGQASKADAPAKSYMVDLDNQAEGSAEAAGGQEDQSTFPGDVEVYRVAGITTPPVIATPEPEIVPDGDFVPEGGDFVPPVTVDIPEDDFVPPVFPVHFKWESKFHKKWKSAQHNKATSKPFPIHFKWKSKFHKKWKSVQHNKLTSKPFPIHFKWKSKFHKKWKSVQHNKLTSKPFPIHFKWKSKFHKKWKSHQHNKLTSKPFPIHFKWKSKFHKKWKSHQHNKLTSKPFPLHIKWKSKFHKKWKSHQHNKLTSKPFPLHIKWKSKFHKKWKSHQHNKLTSKPFPLHIKWKSKFHKKWKSHQHNKLTSKPFPLHIKWKSKFHKKWKSHQHNKLTSKPFPLHIKWKSKFHKKWKSIQHNKKTTRPLTLHIKWKSKFHKKWKSAQHNKLTSKPFPLHIKWKSKFHKKWKSRQHNKATTRPFGVKPLHQKWKSKGYHHKQTSPGRPFHKKWRSEQAKPQHLKRLSRLHKKPVHAKRISRLNKRPVHAKRISRLNKRPVHLRSRSRMQNRPVHLKLRSQLRNQRQPVVRRQLNTTRFNTNRRIQRNTARPIFRLN